MNLENLVKSSEFEDILDVIVQIFENETVPRGHQSFLTGQEDPQSGAGDIIELLEIDGGGFCEGFEDPFGFISLGGIQSTRK